MASFFHITTMKAWRRAQLGGGYRGDTLGTEGFIHCSTAKQLCAVANERFAGRTDLILLCISGKHLASELRWEGGDDETGPFPHIHGVLNIDAVSGTVDFPPGPDGRFSLPEPLRAERKAVPAED